MISKQFARTESVLGCSAMEKLSLATVAIFGVGGVGSFSAEALARSGIGRLVLVDYDIIDVTNINRQIHATHKTIGQAKVEAMKKRLMDINPLINIDIYNERYDESNKSKLISKDYNYIIDAIDTVSSKINLIINSQRMGIPIISSMGAGNKLLPTEFKIGDIYETKVCPLAKIIRRELRKKGVKALKVVWSEEQPIKVNLELTNRRKSIPGSIAFVPSVVGMIIAAEVIRDLTMEV